MDIMTMAMCKPKTIELRNYETSTPGFTFESAILSLFGNGGGILQVQCDNKFWEDVATKRPLRFVIGADALVEGMAVEVCKYNRQLLYGSPVGIDFDFVAMIEGDIFKVDVLMVNSRNATAICLKVTPLMSAN